MHILDRIMEGGQMAVDQTAGEMNIGRLSTPGYRFSPDEKTESVYETIRLNPAITEFVVIENNTAVGFLTRTALDEILGGKYGFTLHSEEPIRDVMETDFLSVDYYTPVDQVSGLAMQRPFERLYHSIVVEHEGGYSGIVTVKDLLDTSTKMALAERDKIALMRDNLKIGLFFMDNNYIIQDQHSRYLEEMLSETDLSGKNFLDLLTASVSASELAIIKDYFDMILGRSFDQNTLDDINPFGEINYVSITTGEKKVFHCDFAAIEQGYEVFVLVSIYDITARVELQQRLVEEENRRHEEMRSIFELIQVEPRVFDDFLDDAECEFERANEALKDEAMSAHEALVEVYQSIHAIKSNAVILGFNTFGDKAHNLESKIKKLRGQQEVPFMDMLSLALELEKLSEERHKFKMTIDRINAFRSSGGGEGQSQARYVLVESLTRTASKASGDMGKKVKFAVGEIEDAAIEKGPRRVIKEVLMQLIRNSVVHGIEAPEDRAAGGKNETGIIRLSIKQDGGNIHVKLGDDGRGLDYGKIAEKALRLDLIKKEDAQNRDALLKAVFSPGFSTAETEGLHAGRGIGLSLVQDRVRAEKGVIKVQTQPGKGTIFNIMFPAGSAA